MDAADLELFSYDDINQVLRAIPGVYLREEDGYGLFPNISLRGADPGRSGKVTLMEDGILMAPAPYSAPSAYYAPTAGRMEGIEVLKGTSQVTQGPHTTGGVINYLSSSIPSERQTTVEASMGSDEDWIGHFRHGDRYERGEQTFGYLFETYHRRNEGFKSIRGAAGGGYEGSDDTGLNRTDYLLKGLWSPSSVHTVEGKIGYSDMEADETYLGLSETDFARFPLERYPASRFDNIATYHTRTYLRHVFQPHPDFVLSTSAYYNRFHRNWYKLDRVDGNSLSSILFNDDPLYSVLIGNAPGELKVKANNRDYYSAGLQSNLVTRFQIGDWDHRLQLGLRYHTDRIRRYQWADRYQQNADGSIADNPGFSGPDKEGNRRQAADALAFYLQNEMIAGHWTFTPGIRIEQVDWEYFRADNRDPDVRDSGNFSMVAPGMSVRYEPDEDQVLFAGLYEGISPPAPSGARSGLEEEQATSFEIGYRRKALGAFSFETLFFFTGFQNLITAESIANGGSDENIGEVDVLGLEMQFGTDLSRFFEVPVRLPLYLSATWTDATFVDPTDGQSDPESIFFGAANGNQLPYIPEWQAYLRLGANGANWSATASLGYVGKRYGTGDNALSDPDDIRVGLLDAHWILDLAADVRLSESWALFGTVTNALDETYIASRLPHGLRPGAPFQWRVGARLSWD